MEYETFKFTGAIARLEFTHGTGQFGPVVTCIAYDPDGNRVHAHAVESTTTMEVAIGIARNLDYFAALLRGSVLCVAPIHDQTAPLSA